MIASTTVCGMEYRKPGGSSTVALFFTCISLAYVVPITVVFTVNSVMSVALVLIIKDIVPILIDFDRNLPIDRKQTRDEEEEEQQ